MSETWESLYRLYEKIKEILRDMMWRSDQYGDIITPKECKKLLDELEALPERQQIRSGPSLFQRIPTNQREKTQAMNKSRLNQYQDRIERFIKYFHAKLSPLLYQLPHSNTDEFKQRWEEVGDLSNKTKTDDFYFGKIGDIYQILFNLSTGDLSDAQFQEQKKQRYIDIYTQRQVLAGRKDDKWVDPIIRHLLSRLTKVTNSSLTKLFPTSEIQYLMMITTTHKFKNAFVNYFKDKLDPMERSGDIISMMTALKELIDMDGKFDQKLNQIISKGQQTRKQADRKKENEMKQRKAAIEKEAQKQDLYNSLLTIQKKYNPWSIVPFSLNKQKLRTKFNEHATEQQKEVVNKTLLLLDKKRIDKLKLILYILQQRRKNSASTTGSLTSVQFMNPMLEIKI